MWLPETIEEALKAINVNKEALANVKQMEAIRMPYAFRKSLQMR